MNRIHVAWMFVVAALPLPSALAQQVDVNQLQAVELNNGMRIIGYVGRLKAMDATVQDVAPDSSGLGIVLISDDLRDVFVSSFSVDKITPWDRQEEHFDIPQRVLKGEANNTATGDILNIGPLDKYGRRTITTMTSRGPETVIQGITGISPRYVRIQGIINSGGPESRWDMRLALSSVPTQVLMDVLHLQIRDPENANERLRLVDFAVQAKKYRQAEDELQAIRRDFPGLRDEMEKRSELLRGQIARQMLDEVRLRINSGQPELAARMMAPLLNRTDLASAVLVDINDVRREMEAPTLQVDKVRQQFEEVAGRAVASGDLEGDLKALAEQYTGTVVRELRPVNLDRMATFTRLLDDAELTDVKKLSLALSGWIVGAGEAVDNMALTQSLMQAQRLVTEFLRTSDLQRREEILTELDRMEGGAVKYIDLILKHIPPPLAPSANEILVDKPMEMPIEIGNPPQRASYLIQLPPEYDPWRKYPCIVSLGGAYGLAAAHDEIQWWCGAVHPRLNIRSGHATRNGYIVISPVWATPEQRQWGFTQREHAIVLKSLRDAMRRFSIDSDRVFLSGHSDGANGAWDIGQSHPEHWAGVIPIGAWASTYINHTFANGRGIIPWYFVNGGRDFAARELNANVWNKRMTSKDYQTVIVQYQGRGNEMFSDELPNLMPWMALQSRQFGVREFECSTMRPWNNYFWWYEVDLSGNPKMIAPEEDWESSKRDNWTVSAVVHATRPNTIRVRGASDNATVWLLPGLVDFSRDLEIESNGQDYRGPIVPSRRVILEDARTRGDRQHAYWSKVVLRNKKWTAAE